MWQTEAYVHNRAPASADGPHRDLGPVPLLVTCLQSQRPADSTTAIVVRVIIPRLHRQTCWDGASQLRQMICAMGQVGRRARPRRKPFQGTAQQSLPRCVCLWRQALNHKAIGPLCRRRLHEIACCANVAWSPGRSFGWSRPGRHRHRSARGFRSNPGGRQTFSRRWWGFRSNPAGRQTFSTRWWGFRSNPAGRQTFSTRRWGEGRGPRQPKCGCPAGPPPQRFV